jgi:putative transposase
VENSDLDQKIAQIHANTRGAYGRRRIAAALKRESGPRPSVNRVSRRMAEIGIAGYTPPSFRRTTIPEPLLEDSPNLLADASAHKIDQIWVSDITYIATKEGWLYLCTVMDLYSRKIVGWATSSRMKADIVLKAFSMAYDDRRPTEPVIFHSDKGGQYKAKRLRRKMARLGVRQSMTGVNHCFDNAAAESFFGTLKRELIRGKIFTSRQEADNAVFQFIEVFYNRVRLHSSIGYSSPVEFEKVS